MIFTEDIFWIWLTLLGRPVNKIAELLFDTFSTPREIWEQCQNNDIPAELSAREKFAERIKNEALREKAYQIKEEAEKKKITVTHIAMARYPSLLKRIYQKPLVLYSYGRLPAELPDEIPLLASVGARSCSVYGSSMSRMLCRSLAQTGIGIVSGMARGIDAQSHMGALEGGGYTIAVLGSGVDVIYPPEHRPLYYKIREQGCILSEFIPGTRPLKQNFPARNRIIAGLSLGILVCEAGKSSGSMITVERAIEEGRDVFVLPGNINSPLSEGCNQLIRSGAVCVTSCSDILQEIGWQADADETNYTGWQQGLSGPEARIAKIISEGTCRAEDISLKVDCSFAFLQSTLTMLEVKGVIEKTSREEYSISCKKRK